jgi:hypothetical protein
MKYSISYKNTAGITLRSECLTFGGDEEALAFAKNDLAATALIEVWKGDDLLARLDHAAKGVRS